LKQFPPINYVGHGHKRCEHLEANIYLRHLASMVKMNWLYSVLSGFANPLKAKIT
jgi:hypothetical protein